MDLDLGNKSDLLAHNIMGKLTPMDRNNGINVMKFVHMYNDQNKPNHMTSARFNSFCKLVISDDDVSMMVVILGIYSRISLGCTLLRILFHVHVHVYCCVFVYFSLLKGTVDDDGDDLDH